MEIDSLGGSLRLASRATGLEVEPYFSHCSLNLGSSLSPTLAAASPFALTGLCLVATGGLLFHCRRLANQIGQKGAGEVRPSAPLAQFFPGTFTSYTLLFLSV